MWITKSIDICSLRNMHIWTKLVFNLWEPRACVKDGISFNRYWIIQSAEVKLLDQHCYPHNITARVEMKVSMQSQPQFHEAKHDTLMIAIMKWHSHERFTSSQIDSIMVSNSHWIIEHILLFPLTKCVHSFRWWLKENRLLRQNILVRDLT